MSEEVWMKQIDPNPNSVYRLRRTVLPIMEGAEIWCGHQRLQYCVEEYWTTADNVLKCKAAVVKFAESAGVIYASKA